MGGSPEELLKKPYSVAIDHRRHSGESRNPFFMSFAFRQGSRALVGNETPLLIHPHPQMDSGFRRNDVQSETPEFWYFPPVRRLCFIEPPAPAREHRFSRSPFGDRISLVHLASAERE